MLLSFSSLSFASYELTSPSFIISTSSSLTLPWWGSIRGGFSFNEEYVLMLLSSCSISWSEWSPVSWFGLYSVPTVHRCILSLCRRSGRPSGNSSVIIWPWCPTAVAGCHCSLLESFVYTGTIMVNSRCCVFRSYLSFIAACWLWLLLQCWVAGGQASSVIVGQTSILLVKLQSFPGQLCGNWGGIDSVLPLRHLVFAWVNPVWRPGLISRPDR